ncbi:unnamed protein product [Rhizophagus irregularis]|nr:unnamed protein product [Rhizophagus irregularis]
MILLDYHDVDVVIEKMLNQPIVNLEPTALDMTVVDFDGVAYHLSTPESKCKSQREELVKKLALIKFERAFEQQAQFEDEKQPNPTPDLMQVGRVLKDVDARRRSAIQNAPQVLY